MTSDTAAIATARQAQAVFRRYTAAEARQMKTTIQAIYERSYVDALASGDPFDSVSSFMGRFDAYASNPNLDLVIAYCGGHPIGQTWGWPLGPRSAWWSGLSSDPAPGFTHEDGYRTFALSEVMVVQEWVGHHIAHALHDTLLGARPEQRATLLVEADNATAYRAYLHWGWEHVGHLTPDWQNAPTFDVLVLDLSTLNTVSAR